MDQKPEIEVPPDADKHDVYIGSGSRPGVHISPLPLFVSAACTLAMSRLDTGLFCQLPQRTLAVVGRCKHRPRLSGYHHRNASEMATCMMRCQGYSLMTTAVMNGFTV